MRYKADFTFGWYGIVWLCMTAFCRMFLLLHCKFTALLLHLQFLGNIHILEAAHNGAASQAVEGDMGYYQHVAELNLQLAQLQLCHLSIMSQLSPGIIQLGNTLLCHQSSHTCEVEIRNGKHKSLSVNITIQDINKLIACALLHHHMLPRPCLRCNMHRCNEAHCKCKWI